MNLGHEVKNFVAFLIPAGFGPILCPSGFRSLGATSWRCSAVMVTMRRFPFYPAPFAPRWGYHVRGYVRIRDPRAPLASRSAVPVERRYHPESQLTYVSGSIGFGLIALA